jgi:hypothetical protein
MQGQAGDYPRQLPNHETSQESEGLQPQQQESSCQEYPDNKKTLNTRAEKTSQMPSGIAVISMQSLIPAPP